MGERFKVKVLMPFGKKTVWLTRWKGSDEASARREFALWKERGASVRLVRSCEMDKHEGNVAEVRGIRVDWPQLCHELADLVTEMLAAGGPDFGFVERAAALVAKAQNGIDLRPTREFAR